MSCYVFLRKTNMTFGASGHGNMGLIRALTYKLIKFAT